MVTTTIRPLRRPQLRAPVAADREVRERMVMAVALVMEVVREPTFDHVLMVLRRSSERELLLLRCRNPEIIAFWRQHRW